MYNSSMNYDIMIPIKIGTFSVIVTILILYFFWLVGTISQKKNKKGLTSLLISHAIILVGGLLLTGFATWLQ